MALGDVTSLRNLALAVSPTECASSTGVARKASCIPSVDAIVFTKGNQATDYVCKEGYLNQIPAGEGQRGRQGRERQRESTVCSCSKTGLRLFDRHCRGAA